MSALLQAVSWIGSHGSRAVALSLLVGMALPPLSALAKPLLPPAVFLLLTLAFLRVGAGRLAPWLRRPRLVVLAVLWAMLAWPVMLGLLVRAGGFHLVAPEIALALTVMAIAPPVMSAPAFAALVGLDASLSLATLIAALIATPLTAPLIAAAVMGDALPLETIALGGRLAAMLAGAWAVALVLRRWLGADRIAASASFVDGLNVLVLFVFAVAIMDGVAARLVTEPVLVLAIGALAAAAAVAMAGSTWLVFLPAGRERALALALAAGNRNMGLMAAAMAGSVPDLAWVFFALGQFPIYMTPLVAQRFAGRLSPPR